MLLLSCVNCAYNGLQTDMIGPAVGYCGEHRCVLTTPEQTTCGRLLRKDLLLRSAQREQALHGARFARDRVSSLASGRAVNGAHTSTKPADIAELHRDPVSAAIADFGQLGTKIESLAQLSALGGARAEIGLATLGRTYVNRCIERGGKWTSGLHLFWWIKSRVADDPEIRIDDLRESRALSLSRQLDLARWSIVMLRLTFLSDVGEHATGTRDHIRRARDLPERAAKATVDLSYAKLIRWVRKEGLRLIDQALPASEYHRRSLELRES